MINTTPSRIHAKHFPVRDEYDRFELPTIRGQRNCFIEVVFRFYDASRRIKALFDGGELQVASAIEIKRESEKKERGKGGERGRKEKRRKKELVDDKRCKHATVYAFFFFFGHRRNRVLIAIFWRRHTSPSPRRPPFPSDNDDSATFESRPGG